MFDRSYLPPAQLEFVVIADTHYMIDPTGQQVEFDSRRRQSARTDHALQLVAGLELPLVIHMGDLIQEFPERPVFAQARQEALAQLARHGIEPRFVAGNHDVGDKPDPTMPASWVTSPFLGDYHERFGRSWYSWDVEGCHFVVLNSQIMNSDLPAAVEQQHWVEADLRHNDGKRIFLFLHLPPFLHNVQEPSLGHYDNLAEPARNWLLDLVCRHQVELLFAAHVHWRFYNQIAQTRYYTVPSVAFTRPGFSELFSSPPPAEQGRDDAQKLGFYLVRVQENGSRVHLLHTNGQQDAPPHGERLITRLPMDLPDSPLGLVARHPVSSSGQVPAAWPSTIRQPVRNDYGLLALLELGVRHLTVPASDLFDPRQAECLAILRTEGVQLTAEWLWEPTLDLMSAVGAIGTNIDAIQMTWLGTLVPTRQSFLQLQACGDAYQLPTTLSCVVPGRNVAGKQHGRSQIGYLPEQIMMVNQSLATHDIQITRLVCRLEGDVWEELYNAPDSAALSHIGRCDWLYALPPGDEISQAHALATAFFSVGLRPGDCFYVEPYIDLDRTMDSGHGLLDRAYNPRPAFALLRHLNTLLHHEPLPETCTLTRTEEEQCIRYVRQSARQRCELVLPVDVQLITVQCQGQPYGLISGLPPFAIDDSTHQLTEPTLFLDLLTR